LPDPQPRSAPTVASKTSSDRALTSESRRDHPDSTARHPCRWIHQRHTATNRPATPESPPNDEESHIKWLIVSRGACRLGPRLSQPVSPFWLPLLAARPSRRRRRSERATSAHSGDWLEAELVAQIRPPRRPLRAGEPESASPSATTPRRAASCWPGLKGGASQSGDLFRSNATTRPRTGRRPLLVHGRTLCPGRQPPWSAESSATVAFITRGRRGSLVLPRERNGRCLSGTAGLPEAATAGSAPS
jgi:hypothetical protein